MKFCRYCSNNLSFHEDEEIVICNKCNVRFNYYKWSSGLRLELIRMWGNLPGKTIYCVDCDCIHKTTHLAIGYYDKEVTNVHEALWTSHSYSDWIDINSLLPITPQNMNSYFERINNLKAFY